MRWFPKAIIALGIWIVVSPWLLGAESVTPIRWSNVIAGVAVALIGCWMLWGTDTTKQ